MQRVLVLDRRQQPLMPCAPARARQLLRAAKAVVFRRFPLTIILKQREGGDTQPLEMKFDPGSKTTGLALVAEGNQGRRVVLAAELTHRSQQISKDLAKRAAIRRARRNRKTRYRPARFKNRAKLQGWLAPSLNSRVDNCDTWAQRLCRFAPVTAIAVETARFDMQLMQNPQISGVEYQQGALAGYELREYLLQRDRHTCVYCGGLSGDQVLEVEHFVPRSKRGSNRVSNLNIACRTCNSAKDKMLPQAWRDALSPSRHAIDKARVKGVKRLLAGQQASLRDAAAVNATRYAIGHRLKATGLPVSFWSGGRTKFNRTQQGYSKAHWLDAACVGNTGAAVFAPTTLEPLLIRASGHGSRQACRVNKYGFPRTKAKGAKFVKGFQTGDMVVAKVLTGNKAGQYRGRVAVRSTGSFNVQTPSGVTQGISYKWCQAVHKKDGYAYN